MILPYKDKVSGTSPAKTSEYEIASNTAVKAGAVVKLSGNLIIPVLAAETADILGVAVEAHSGAASAIDPRENGERVLVYDNPAQAFSAKAPVLTAAAGSNTTTLIASGIAITGTDDALNGGFVKLVFKVAASTNTDPVGTVYEITDFDASEATLTVSEAGGAITAGDKFELYPPRGYTEFSFASDATEIAVSAIGQSATKIAGYMRDSNGEMVGLQLYATKHFYK